MHARTCTGLLYTDDVESMAFLKRLRLRAAADAPAHELDAIRIAVVRDPYERLLSGYLDKFAPNPKKPGERTKQSKAFKYQFECAGDYTNNFATFVECIFIMYNKLGGCTHDFCSKIDAHIRPQVCCSSINVGGCHFSDLKYDYLLPVHSMAEWYLPLVKCLGIEPYVKDYWGTNKRGGQRLAFADNMPDPNCTRGIISTADKATCCSASCEKCGGATCASQQGVRRECCSKTVDGLGRSCNDVGPPCKEGAPSPSPSPSPPGHSNDFWAPAAESISRGSTTTHAAQKVATFYLNTSTGSGVGLGDTYKQVRAIYAGDLAFCSEHSKANQWC